MSPFNPPQYRTIQKMKINSNNKKKWESSQSSWPRKSGYKRSPRANRPKTVCRGEQLVPNWMNKLKTRRPERPKSAKRTVCRNVKKNLHLIGARPYLHYGYNPALSQAYFSCCYSCNNTSFVR